MQFSSLTALLAASAAIVNAAPVEKRDKPEKAGLLGDMCDQVSNRFYKFGSCLSTTPQFQQLNSTFWYQAVKQGLCGDEMQLPPMANSSLFQNFPFKQVKFDDEDDEDTVLAKESELLYMNKLSQDESLEKRDDTASTIGNIVNIISGSTALTMPQCLKACEEVQSASNLVDGCWKVTSLTVLYGVCEIGCRVYL